MIPFPSHTDLNMQLYSIIAGICGLILVFVNIWSFLKLVSLMRQRAISWRRYVPAANLAIINAMVGLWVIATSSTTGDTKLLLSYLDICLLWALLVNDVEQTVVLSFAIKKPIRYAYHITRQKYIIAIAFVWISAAAFLSCTVCIMLLVDIDQ